MKLKIDIETKVFVRLVAVLGAFGIGLFVLWLLRAPLTLLLVAGFLALALNPPVSRLAKLLPRQSRIGATALSYLVVVAFLGGFLVLILPPIVQQTTSFIQQVPDFINSLEKQQGPARDFLNRYGLEEQLDNAIENAKTQASNLASNIGSTFVSSVGAILNGFVAVLTVLVLTFLLLIEGPAWKRRILNLYTDEPKRDQHEALINRMYHVVTGYVNGQVLVASISATCTLVVLFVLSTIFNFPAGLALPLAVIIFFASMIPMVGATIGATIVALVLLFNSLTAALIFVVYFLIYQQIENNLIQPTVQARTVELTALTVITAVIFGVALMGFLGALIAIPVAGCLRVLFLHHVEQRQHQAKMQPENVVHKLKKTLFGNKTKNA